DDGDRRTLQLCSRADHVIWCTPAMQAWKASEERAWLSLPKKRRERGVVAVTFEDAIASPADAGRLLGRLQAEAGAHFRRIVFASECSALVPHASCEKTGGTARARSLHQGLAEHVAAGPLR